MKTLRGIPGRTAFVQYAARADSEDAALLFQQMSELLAGYHRSVAPIQRLDIYLNVPVAYTAGSAVVLLPIDRLLWTERTSRIAAGLAKTLPKPLPVQRSPAAVDRMIRKLAGRCEKLHCCYEDAVLIKAEPWSASRLVWSATAPSHGPDAWETVRARVMLV